MEIPDDLAGLLAGAAQLDSIEQAFVFLTIDAAGFVHPCLLSRAEITVAAGRDALVAVVAGATTTGNLQRHGRATLIAVGGTTAHYAKLVVKASLASGGLVGFLLDVVDHRRDSLDIALTPITFRATAALASEERWEASALIAAALFERRSADVPPGGTVD